MSFFAMWYFIMSVMMGLYLGWCQWMVNRRVPNNPNAGYPAWKAVFVGFLFMPFMVMNLIRYQLTGKVGDE